MMPPIVGAQEPERTLLVTERKKALHGYLEPLVAAGPEPVKPM